MSPDKPSFFFWRKTHKINPFGAPTRRPRRLLVGNPFGDMPPPAPLFLSLPPLPQPLLPVHHRKAPHALNLNLPLTSSRKPALPARPVASLAPAVATRQSDWTRKQVCSNWFRVCFKLSYLLTKSPEFLACCLLLAINCVGV